MPWIRLPGVEGLVYEPRKQKPSERKHNCADCFWCQWCPDTRCAECLKRKAHLESKKIPKKRKK